MEREFKDILREILKDNNFTQVQFARSIGVKQSQVSEWLKGKAKPGYDNLRAMVYNLGIPAEYLLGILNDYYM